MTKETQTVKQCVYCGAELPQDAAFCPACARSQQEPVAQKPPRVWRKKAAILGASALALVLVSLILLLTQTPRIYDGDAELSYQGYHLVLTPSVGPDQPKSPNFQFTQTIPPRVSFGVPDQLYAYRSNDMENAREAFLELVDSVQMTAAPRDGAQQLETSDPTETQDFPEAALMGDLFYRSDCGINDITWTLRMKNGDVLRLHQVFEVIEQQIISIYPEDAPMDTIEELQALVDRLAVETDEDTMVDIYLPAVTYTGGLRLDKRAFSFYGATEGTGRTVFTGPSRVSVSNPEYVEFWNITFAGSGGTGLHATDGVAVWFCTFTGWDVGVLSTEWSWASVHGTTFLDNDVGFQFNSHSSRLVSTEYDQCQFRNNRIGFYAKAVPGEYVLTFPDTVFSGNETDILNEAEYSMDTSGATFE